MTNSSSPNASDLKTKQEWRAWAKLERKRACDPEDLSHAARLVEALPALLDPESVVAAYWPIGSEPDLRPAYQKLYEQGFMIALPVVVERNAPLAFRQWTPTCEMITDLCGIPCPPESMALLTPTHMLIPGLCFSRGGGRLGSGQGYYDRTIATLHDQGGHPILIGVGFEALIVEHLPTEDHDVAMNHLLTQSCLYPDLSA